MIPIPEWLKKNKQYVVLAAAIATAVALAIDGKLLEAIASIDKAVEALE